MSILVETTGYTIQSAGLHGENMNHPNILKHCGNLHLSRSANFIVVAVVVVVVAVISNSSNSNVYPGLQNPLAV